MYAIKNIITKRFLGGVMNVASILHLILNQSAIDFVKQIALPPDNFGKKKIEHLNSKK
jgi:hypothetical protein